jgi:hypothetical protein
VWPEKINLRFILYKPAAQKGAEELSAKYKMCTMFQRVGVELGDHINQRPRPVYNLKSILSMNSANN